ncbi:GGDEF domain-containing protein [Oceanisphaera pacifica]|uniref:diguanylate cyclase n=1 Tax=Oceanisphaera pacifica TaxID=2818389 RepID=A0ABS3NG25_9GAMM|nr:GGDEF domain-containing protein [Oceanisphaera pacifica]MBO1519536.1 GGDEF domain-containing protein [Oceanisphaera pacifica]
MTIQLDFRTLSLTLMLFSLVFGLGMFAYSKEHAKFSGIKTMGMGYFLIGGGCVLLGLRHFIHDIASILLSNVAIISGVVLINRGLFNFLGISLRFERWLSPLLIVLLAAALSFYTFYIPNVSLRIQAFSLTFALICFIGAGGVLQHNKPHGRMAANMLMVMFLLIGAFFIFRLMWTFYESPPDDFMNAGLLSALAVIAGEFLVILSSFSTIWMASDELQHELSEIARIDPLTGVYNRRAFDEYCETELSRALRSQTSFAIIMCDLDNFKRVNDEHGHHIGDEVLKRFATTLKENTRQQDVVARFGGEEFVLLLPNNNTKQGLLAAEQLRAKTAATQIAIGNNVSLSISASFGVAHYDAHDNDWSTVLHRADNALYMAKKQGRNRVIGHPSTSRTNDSTSLYKQQYQ